MNLAELSQFHFLRPQLLWLIIPAALLCWGLARSILNTGRLQQLIDPDLLPHLLLRGGDKRPWLFSLIFALLCGMIIALAGPSWRKLPTPVYSNQDALVILLDLSPSMMASDLKPSRLTRARLKILDILKQRRDGLTALVAYAGEAYVVTPLTDDTSTIANLVPSLSPGIVPVPGSNIEMAIESARRLLKDGANGRGEILAITDGIDSAALPEVTRLVKKTGIEFSILAVGSGDGSPIPKSDGSGFVTDSSGAIIIANFNPRALQKLAAAGAGRYAKITVDDSDIARLLPRDKSPRQAQRSEREFDQWREEGPWILLLLLPFAALLFRRGALACAIPAALLLPHPSQAFEWQQLWQREDQRAAQLLQNGEAKEAAEQFKNPQWRGTANYRAGDFAAAAKDFARGGSARADYNLGNSLTHQGRYDEAIKAYDQALALQPQFADAEHNRDIARQLKDLQQSRQQQQSQDQDQSGQQQSQKQDQSQEQDQSEQPQSPEQQQSQAGEQSPSESQQPAQQPENNQAQNQQSQSDQSEQNEQGEQDQSAQQQSRADQSQGEEQQQPQNQQGREERATAGAREGELDPETQQALDQWLRQVPDDPAGLMRQKFKYESLQRRRAYRSGEWQPPENGATQRW